MDPKCFVYGDGVWGISREGTHTFREWCAYFAERDELEYDDPPVHGSGDSDVGAG